MKFLRIVVFGFAACSLPVIGIAQWQWIDKDGRKVFSDQSPPADIPAKNILKHPGGKGQATSVVAPASSAALAMPVVPASAVAAAARLGASAPKVSGKDKELEEKKKQAEAAEADKQKAEDDKMAKARADNCTRAKQGKANYDSGVRIATTNARGEREVMDDATRATEVKRLRAILETDCKSS